METTTVNKMAKKPSSVHKAFARITSIPTLSFGLLLFCGLLFLAIFGQSIAPYDPKALVGGILVAPCWQHPLGTDQYGRDVLSIVLCGARISLIIGFIAAGISGIVGTTLGAISGFFGGWVDQFVTFFMDVFYMTPTFFLILIVVALFGSSITNIVVVIGLTSWVSNARMMRTQAVALRERNFVKGASTIGEGRWRILLRHIVPNGIFPIIVNTTMNISGAILSEAGLSFLGLGDPNVTSWGKLINEGKGQLVGGWWVATFAGLALVICVWTFFLIGDGLNKLITPKLQKAN